MPSLTLVETEEFQTLLKEAVAEGIRLELPSALERANQKKYLTTAEVSDLTGWTARQLAYRRKARTIPFYKRGRTVLYLAREVYRWIEEGRVPATAFGAIA